jgi:hypothetical protein
MQAVIMRLGRYFRWQSSKKNTLNYFTLTLNDPALVAEFEAHKERKQNLPVVRRAIDALSLACLFEALFS